MAVQAGRVSCEACGRHYLWKPELAGKRVKCKCGAALTVPERSPGSAGTAESPVSPATPAPTPAAASRPAGASASGAPAANGARPPVRPAKSLPAPAAPVAPARDDFDVAALDLGGAPETDAAVSPPPYAPPVEVTGAAGPSDRAAKKPGAAGADAAGSRFPSSARGGKFDDAAANKAEVKKIIIVGLAVVLVIGLIIGARFAMKRLGGPDIPDNLPGRDRQVALLTREHGAFEAKQWLKDAPHRGPVGFFWARERTEGKVTDWYEHGAKKVLAFGNVMTSCLAIELPADPEQRKYFFNFAEFHRLEHFPSRPAQKEEKQKYVIIDFM